MKTGPRSSTAHTVDCRRTAEFADRDDQRFVQQPARSRSSTSAEKPDVEDRAQHVFQPVKVLGVGVPQRIIDGVVARHPRPLDVHQANARFDQGPSEQDALAPGVSAVAIA